MQLTPDEERQLEYLLRKKYGGSSESSADQTMESLTSVPPAEPAEGSAKVHGDKIQN